MSRSSTSSSPNPKHSDAHKSANDERHHARHIHPHDVHHLCPVVDEAGSVVRLVIGMPAGVFAVGIVAESEDRFHERKGDKVEEEHGQVPNRGVGDRTVGQARDEWEDEKDHRSDDGE